MIKTTEPTTFEEVRERTRQALGVTEMFPNVWNNFCMCFLKIQERDHPEADEQTILLLAEMAIYNYVLERRGQMNKEVY